MRAQTSGTHGNSLMMINISIYPSKMKCRDERRAAGGRAPARPRPGSLLDPFGPQLSQLGCTIYPWELPKRIHS